MLDWIAAIQQLWVRQIEAATKTKHRQFGKQAARAWGFLEKNYTQLHMIEDEDGEPRAFMDATGPRHRVRRNLAREYVNLMMPYVFAHIPNRLATPRRPPLPPELAQLFPMAPQTKAGLPVAVAEAFGSYMLSWFLNWTPTEYNLMDEYRMGLPEALVKGRAVFWYSIQNTASGPIPVTEYDSVDYMLIDPDCEHYRDAAYIIRKRRLSAWRLSKMTGVPAKEIRRKYASYASMSASLNEFSSKDGDDDSESDIVEYYEVFSRYGVGAQLPNASPELEELASALETLGPYIYLMIVPGMEYPLNLHPEAFGAGSLEAELRARISWPLPLFENYDPWPCTVLDFSPNSKNPWAASPLQGALPLLIFLDHAYSWLMGRIRVSSRDLILCAQEIEESLDEAIESGVDQQLITASLATIKEIENYVHVLQFPEIKTDVFNVIARVEHAFERASGMAPLLYGETGGRQMRSATEADIRQDNAVSRAEYMAECVESGMSRVAQKEAVLTRLFVPPPYALFGEMPPESGQPDMTTPFSLYWSALVNTTDPAEAVGEYTYRVEAGTARRKNKQAQVADMQSLTQTLAAPALQVWTSTGDPRVFNGLVATIGQAMDTTLDHLMLPPMMMQPAPVPGEEPPPEESEQSA